MTFLFSFGAPLDAGGRTAFQVLRISKKRPKDPPLPGNRIACGTNEAANGFMAGNEMIHRPVFPRLAADGLFVHPPVTRGNEGDEVRSADEKKKEPLARTGGGADARKDRNIGDALRRVYSEAVDERIPDDLLDLLSKLD